MRLYLNREEAIVLEEALENMLRQGCKDHSTIEALLARIERCRMLQKHADNKPT